MSEKLFVERYVVQQGLLQHGYLLVAKVLFGVDSGIDHLCFCLLLIPLQRFFML